MVGWKQTSFSFLCLGIIIAITNDEADAQQIVSSNPQSLRVLHSFNDANAASQWQIVNDGVMGGRSSSSATITGQGKLRFTGDISLANNGGFASVRSRPTGTLLGLRSGGEIVLRVKGDGRKYTFSLYTPDRRTAFAYQMDFQTVSGQWQEVRLPVDRFVAHSFGRAIPSMRLNPSQVQALGILLSDKRSGPFQIDVDSITVQ